MTNTQAIELVLKTFFNDNDIINQMINQDDLEKRMNDLENRLLKLAKTTHCQVETIEKLERQIAELEDVLKCDDTRGSLESLANQVDGIKYKLNNLDRRFQPL